MAERVSSQLTVLTVALNAYATVLRPSVCRLNVKFVLLLNVRLTEKVSKEAK